MRRFGAGDYVIIVGLCSLIYGVKLMHIPSAFILAGLTLCIVGYLGSSTNK